MLKACDYPDSLNSRQVHYINIEGVDLQRALRLIERAIGQIRLDSAQGKFPPTTPKPLRPPVPQPQSGEDISDVYAKAASALSQNNLKLAQDLFEQVKKADSGGLGVLAEKRLGEMDMLRQRDILYANIVKLAANPATSQDAQDLWDVYVPKYGDKHDPQNLAALWNKSFQTPPPPVIQTPPQPKIIPITDILPLPFEWCDIPKGFVTLEDESNNRGTKGGKFEVAAFQMAKYPITKSQYQVFVDAPDGYIKAQWWDYSPDALAWRTSRSTPEETAFAGDDSPRTNVCWFDSVAFCRWLSNRMHGGSVGARRASPLQITLPTEQQWQRAAQGDDNLKYPWGYRIGKSRCNYGNNVGQTTPVTQYPTGASPFGVMDMSGNVWEWCLTKWGGDDVNLDSNSLYMLRGGSWFNDEHDTRVTYRYGDSPDTQTYGVGFRLALSY